MLRVVYIVTAKRKIKVTFLCLLEHENVLQKLFKEKMS